MIEHGATQQPTRASSIYEQQRRADCLAMDEFYEGDLNALFCVVSYAQIPEPERAALRATAQQGGFRPQDILWVNIAPARATSPEQLTADDLLQLIESVDPLCIAVLDQRASEMLSRAYNQPIKLECCDALLGRPCCCFVDFARMPTSDQRKQQAWALLKEMLLRTNDL